MANFQLASILVDSEANILSKTGLYIGQKAIVNNRSGAEMYWNGSAWKWSTMWQPLSLLRVPFTLQSNTTEQIAHSYSLPALGANDMLRINHFWTLSGSGAKNARVTIDGAGGVGHSVNLAAQQVGNMVVEMRNMNSTSSQRWFSNNIAVYGGTSGSLVSTSKSTNAVGKIITISGQKGVSGDAMVLEWADVWVCGGG